MMNKLEVDSVRLEFGSKTILSDVYMCFETGHVTGILGRNGAGKFSFGQKRLIETCVILKSESEFVLLDEPFSYLMPIHVERLTRILAAEKRKKGIVITDHLYHDLVKVSDHLYLVSDGSSRPVKGLDDLRQFGYLQ